MILRCKKRNTTIMHSLVVGKQRAAVKWLLSKAFNNKVPENLKEPFYRNHEDKECLKPQIMGGLANAELYCMALGNIFSDPNYHNLNHGAILQTLSRKGVFINESDSQLTETILIQTNPLRMNAHMAVIESVMTLYAKEVVTPDRVLGAVQRFCHERNTPSATPENYEQGLVMWISHACEALKRKIEQDLGSGATNGGDIQEEPPEAQAGTSIFSRIIPKSLSFLSFFDKGDRLRPPNFPPIRELKDLCDGVGLAALVSYYCPDELPWSELKVSYVPTVHESLHNVNLLQNFCNRCLPCPIFHLSPEDITYMRDSMKLNVTVFLADLFNTLEIQTLYCVKYPGSNENFPPRNMHGVVHKRNLLQTVMVPIPDLRSGLDDADSSAFQVSRSAPTHVPLRKTNSVQSVQHSISQMSEDSLRRGSEDSFVVHRGKNIPTLSRIVMDEPLMPARLRENKERQNNDTKADERGEYSNRPSTAPAGKPSNWQDSRTNTFSGRRSRRNSTSDDSQLTIENFGGSQDNLNFIGRNPDKEVAVHVGRKISTPTFPVEGPVVALRSSIQDAKGSIQFGYDDEEKKDNGTEKFVLRRQLSSDDIALRKMMNSSNSDKENIIRDLVDGEVSNRISSTDANKQNSGIQLVYMQQDSDESQTKSEHKKPSEKKTSFAALPSNQTTWQQQSSNQQRLDSNGGENGVSNNVTPQLSDIRLKLEEKRRQIENEKRRLELAMNKNRQKIGKQAFLQAVTKGKGNLLKTPENDSNSNSTEGSETQSPNPDPVSVKSERPFTLKDVTDDAAKVERKWMDNDQSFMETKRTPELENMNMEQYQQSIAQIDSSLYDIHNDIQRLTSQQNQIQAAQQQNLIAQQQRQIQALQQQQYQSPLTPQYTTQHSFNTPIYHPPSPQVYPIPLQQSSSVPHIPQSLYTAQPQFFLHDQQAAQHLPHIPQPVAPQRRTWAQQSQSPLPVQMDNYHQSENMRTWGRPQNPAGFMLHDKSERLQTSPYQNGDNRTVHHSNSFTLSQQYLHQQQSTPFGTSHSTPSASPQHRIHKQISQLMDDVKRSPVSLQQMELTPQRKLSVTHAPIPAPSADDMEPQNISFIGNSDEQALEGIGRLNITSGTRTYRIPSPTRPSISRNSFQPSSPPCRESKEIPIAEVSSLDNDPTSQKGFYISFDNEQPKRPKPPLRTKRGSPKKERSFVDSDENSFSSRRQEREQLDRLERKQQLERELQEEKERKDREEEEHRRQQLMMERERIRERNDSSQERRRLQTASAIIIGNELQNPDPDLQDEREKKKERIMMLSLQRRQQQEEAKAKKEEEARVKKEKEKAKEEEKARRKEEMAARRAAIFEQYKLKKALEEAEREGKSIDKSEYMAAMKPTPKIRPKASVRPRPKTIHIDSGSVEMAEGMLQPSRGKKGSTSNLTANSFSPHSTMKRDYYRGSQDSLADRSLSSGMLYRDSPDDSRGMSPCQSANQTLGRRSSYKNSRVVSSRTSIQDPSPAQARGRSKFSTYQNFKGRKSSSLMNLYGSSSDQDSFAYRYGETDSGLGRATPPRRAPSPGMGSLRHLPSPSGPGSLPGLMSKGRRMFDDGSSDISSTPSSMMDYNGPRLYKQPATKSNRGLMLNAVEYCVFPGVVNKEAKRRVLDEIGKSESKHFLILFRDAGCQFRALYSYCPDREEVAKLYGTGPKHVNDRMFDKFFKYNSGTKCFSQIHTKHLTVTIDAFTIHNSLWQGKKVNLPNKKDMALVI
ncbi:patronin isoform X5 [Harmonia axyridis]|uniref:patronin isoform X5 n=1 Tax=Harmonia axyridis TaxID=115357 RepID=UPI001E279635|nr:patronin isoform X5 [Harmonia axyridis]